MSNGRAVRRRIKGVHGQSARKKPSLQRSLRKIARETAARLDSAGPAPAMTKTAQALERLAEQQKGTVG